MLGVSDIETRCAPPPVRSQVEESALTVLYWESGMRPFVREAMEAHSSVVSSTDDGEVCKERASGLSEGC